MATSWLVSSARRRQRERMSPTAGPPRTRTISAVLPPSSETGRNVRHSCGQLSSMACTANSLTLSQLSTVQSTSILKACPSPLNHVSGEQNEGPTCNTIESCASTEYHQQRLISHAIFYRGYRCVHILQVRLRPACHRSHQKSTVCSSAREYLAHTGPPQTCSCQT